MQNSLFPHWLPAFGPYKQTADRPGCRNRLAMPTSRFDAPVSNGGNQNGFCAPMIGIPMLLRQRLMSGAAGRNPAAAALNARKRSSLGAKLEAATRVRAPAEWHQSCRRTGCTIAGFFP
jgi:hypothetical protein